MYAIEYGTEMTELTSLKTHIQTIQFLGFTVLSSYLWAERRAVIQLSYFLAELDRVNPV